MPRFPVPHDTSNAPSPLTARSTVLVTGGSGGIGRAICLEFGRAGWRVGVHYHTRKDDAEHIAAMVKELGGEGRAYRADLRHAACVRQMVQDCTAQWGRLDVMVCNAGQASSRLLLRLKPEEWASIIEINLTGTFHCLKSAGAVMLAQGAGSVIVVSSYAGVQGGTGQTVYAASKAGLLGLVKTAAREWGGSNVRVNAILPGWHRTALSGGTMPDPGNLDDHVLARTPDLQEVAGSVYHLALLKDASGQIWNLDSRIVY